MTKEERIRAALRKQDVDRIPFSVWYHLPQYDQDPIALAEEQLRLAQLYDLDFIKMMPFGNYGAQDYGLSVTFYCTETEPAFERKFGIASPEDWLRLEPLPAYYGTYGKQVQLAQYTEKLTGGTIPFVQTIFSPLTTAKKLAGPRIFDDLREHPDYVHQALAAITETTKNFIAANIEAGVAGFFFATQCSSPDYLTEAEHKEFCEKYDREVIGSYADKTWFNIMHAHGDNTYFKTLAEYPVNCINWHDRWASPNMEQARAITDKCLLGGINEIWMEHASYQDVPGHLQEAVEGAGRNGLMLTPGCCIQLNTPRENLLTAAIAARRL